MQSFEFIVKEKAGLHARTSSLLVKNASLYESKITLEKGEKRANGKSLLGVLALGAKFGDKIIFFMEGEDEVIAAKELESFCNKNV